MKHQFVRTVLYYLGLALTITGFIMLLPAVAAYFFQELVSAFFIPATISIISGIFMMTRYEAGEVTMGRAMTLSALAFIVIAFVGAIPYIMQAQTVYGEVGVNAYVSAYFESMSGFTTTGLSTLPDITAVPESLLFWRSLTQWIGGVGIIVLFLLFFVSKTIGSSVPGMSAYYLFRGGANEERLEPSTAKSVKGIAKIYIFYTIAGLAIYRIAGMPMMDAINHILTSVSTGGFSTQAASTGIYGSAWIDASIGIFMIVGATSFLLHYKLLGLRWKDLGKFAKSYEMKVWFIFMAIFSGALSLHFWISGVENPAWKGIFQIVSASTTTGFVNMDLAGMGDLGLLLITFVMFIGGSAGSTAGGLKIIRFLILLEAIPWTVRKFLLPKKAVLPLKFGTRIFGKDEISQVSVYLFIYLFITFIGTIIFTIIGYPFIESLFEITSAAATVGMSTGITQFTMPIIGKIVLILEMLLGRLEILPVLVLFMAALNRKRWGSFYE
ncbi:TPA: TrkH family potassium uptake protein [archaeon]|nr:TrkH family potassium uptake protein [Candidatus Undinarchaeales archaeon SRR5007147.bin71]